MTTGNFSTRKFLLLLIILTVALSILKPLYTKILKFILRREVVLFLFLPLIFYIPQRDIFISSVNQLSLDNKNGYDFTFMQPQKDMNELKYEKLMDDPIVAVISTKNPLSSSSLLSIKDLRDEKFVAYYRSINLRDFTDDFCKNVGGFVPNVAFESTIILPFVI